MPNGADEEQPTDNQGTPTEFTSEDRGNDDKLFQARVLLEKNQEVYGAEIILFDRDEQEINRILITDDTKYGNFSRYVSNLNKAYVPYTAHDVEIVEIISSNDESSDEYVSANQEWSKLSEKKDLETILQNNINKGTETASASNLKSYIDDGQSIINATHLNGFDSGNYSKTNHTHDDRYLGTAHKEVIGVNDTLGHLKMVDNLTTSETSGGQVLSANQGRELNNRLESLENKFSWRSVHWNQYLKYHINPDLKLISVEYYREGYSQLKAQNGNKVLHTGFPYLPTRRVITPLHRGDVSFYIDTNGSINLYNLTRIDKLTINCQLLYHYK